jgi:hypothetical protein
VFICRADYHRRSWNNGGVEEKETMNIKEIDFEFRVDNEIIRVKVDLEPFGQYGNKHPTAMLWRNGATCLPNKVVVTMSK